MKLHYNVIHKPDKKNASNVDHQRSVINKTQGGVLLSSGNGIDKCKFWGIKNFSHHVNNCTGKCWNITWSTTLYLYFIRISEGLETYTECQLNIKNQYPWEDAKNNRVANLGQTTTDKLHKIHCDLETSVHPWI